MVRLQDLWIGDKVLLTKSGRIGSYLGKTTQGKARIKVEESVYLVDPKFLQSVADDSTLPSVDDLLGDMNTKSQSQIISDFKSPNIYKDNSIDLHIEKLAPDMLKQPASMILNFQKQQTYQFIKASIAAKTPIITIIHGRGAGVLREEVIIIAQQFSEIRFTFQTNNNGALEVWLHY